MNMTTEDTTPTAASLDRLINNLLPFAKPSGSLLTSQRYTTCPYYQPYAFNTPQCSSLKAAFYNHHPPIYVYVFQWLPCLQVFQFTNTLQSSFQITCNFQWPGSVVLKLWAPHVLRCRSGSTSQHVFIYSCSEIVTAFLSLCMFPS